jgi:hypothetical protein
MTARCEPRFWIVSSSRPTRRADQLSDTEAFADFPQSSRGWTQSNGAAIDPAEFVDPALPAPGATFQPLEDPGQLRRGPGDSLAKEPTGVLDQIDKQQVLEPSPLCVLNC